MFDCDHPPRLHPDGALRFRDIAWAMLQALDFGARRTRLSVVKNFGTKYERVVWGYKR